MKTRHLPPTESLGRVPEDARAAPATGAPGDGAPRRRRRALALGAAAVVAVPAIGSAAPTPDEPVRARVSPAGRARWLLRGDDR